MASGKKENKRKLRFRSYCSDLSSDDDCDSQKVTGIYQFSQKPFTIAFVILQFFVLCRQGGILRVR